ncbi:uncharacterized protein LOC127010501 [Drosophila biarmipes]|uniref:uncharacterized protein LOC127010501 n=1 Tax=Drosophila biarmipes TaxID=125945 RepID=UPI0021CD0634|nr:uncharacterized protein LOC127010501 [Drosophila biarmipes]
MLLRLGSNMLAAAFCFGSEQQTFKWLAKTKGQHSGTLSSSQFLRVHKETAEHFTGAKNMRKLLEQLQRSSSSSLPLKTSQAPATPPELTATPPHPPTILGTALGKPKGNILRLGLFS